MKKTKKFLIAPSILSANFACLGQDITNVINAGGDIIHFDVMDNHYVPNLTIGPLVLKSIRDYGILAPIDIHLMADPIDNLIIKFSKYGYNNYITFHPETSKDINKSIELIKKNGCKVGLAFKISTNLNFLNNQIIKKIDLITLMAVNPGFSGQKLIPEVYNKIIQIKKIINTNSNILLGLDGGININNIYKIGSFGINMFIIGSAIFNNQNYKSIIKNMRKELSKIKK